MYVILCISYCIFVLATVLWFPSNIEKVSGKKTSSSDPVMLVVETALAVRYPDYWMVWSLNADRSGLPPPAWPITDQLSSPMSSRIFKFSTRVGSLDNYATHYAGIKIITFWILKNYLNVSSGIRVASIVARSL